MRVAVIGHGSMIHSVPFLRHMVDAGLEVHWLQIAPGRIEVPGVRVHRCFGRGGYKTVLGKLDYFLGGLRARAVLRRIKPDVVNSHYASSGGLAAWLSGFRPYAVTIHGSDLIDRSRTIIGRAILRRVFSSADLVNLCGEHMVPILENLGVPTSKMMVLPRGIELERFPFRPKEPDPRGRIRIICTRSLGSAVYDIPTVLRGLAEARGRGLEASLTLAAGGKMQGRFQSLAGELGVADSVLFRGGYSPDELPGLLAEHDAYVSASLWDGASQSLMEAMACGTFPIVSDIPANREWLKDGRDCLLFPAGDWRRLAEILLDLPRRGELIRQAVAANRRTVEARADRKRNLGKLTDRLVGLSARGTTGLPSAGGGTRSAENAGEHGALP